jgi:hypothetical protein
MPPLGMIEPNGPHLAQRGLDTLVSSGRVLAAYGLQGAASFTLPDGDAPGYNPGDRKYPDDETPRVVLRTHEIPLTPGHVVALEVVALPGGPTQYQPTANEWKESSRGGTVELAVTYSNDDPATVDAVASVTPSASLQIYGAEPPNRHARLETHSSIASPYSQPVSGAALELYGRGGDVTAQITVSYVGSPRVVDLAVVERPYAMVVDKASSEWPSAMYTSGDQAYAVLPSDYPVTKIATADPAGGVEGIRRALEQHGLQLGPCLAWMTSAREASGTQLAWINYDDGTGIDDEAPPVTNTSATDVMMPYAVAYNANLPGFPTGGYGRQARDSDEWFDGRTGVLPVWAAVYAKATAGRFTWRTAGANEWSSVSLPVTGGAYAWFVKPGWIEVGTSPEDGPLLRLFGRRTGSSETWGWRAGGVFMRQR